MHTKHLPIGVWALAAVALSVIFSPAQANDVGGAGWSVSVLLGQAQWRPENGQAWAPLRTDDHIQAPVYVRTGSGGQVTLQRSGDSVSISPGSLIFIPTVEQRAETWFTRIVQKIGVVTYDVKKRPRPGFQVETQYLTSLVKGTLFEVATGVDQAAVTLLRGSLLVSKADRSESVLIRPMQTASVSQQNPQLRVTTLRRLPPQPTPKPSAPKVEPKDDSSAGQELDDVSTFSWAEDVGLGTVTQTVSSLSVGADSQPALGGTHPPTHLDRPIAAVGGSIDAIEADTGPPSFGTVAVDSGLAGDGGADVGEVMDGISLQNDAPSTSTFETGLPGVGEDLSIGDDLSIQMDSPPSIPVTGGLPFEAETDDIDTSALTGSILTQPMTNIIDPSISEDSPIPSVGGSIPIVPLTVTPPVTERSMLPDL